MAVDSWSAGVVPAVLTTDEEEEASSPMQVAPAVVCQSCGWLPVVPSLRASGGLLVEDGFI